MHSQHHQWDEELLGPPCSFQQSGWHEVAFRGDRVSVVTTRWQSRHRNAPPPQGDLQGLPGFLLGRWPLLVDQCHQQALSWAIPAWSPGRSGHPVNSKHSTKLPKGKGKLMKVHNQPAGVQLHDKKWLKTRKTSRRNYCQPHRGFFPCTSSRLAWCIKKIYRSSVQTSSERWQFCQRRIMKSVDRRGALPKQGLCLELWAACFLNSLRAGCGGKKYLRPSSMTVPQGMTRAGRKTWLLAVKLYIAVKLMAPH